MANLPFPARKSAGIFAIFSIRYSDRKVKTSLGCWSAMFTGAGSEGPAKQANHGSEIDHSELYLEGELAPDEWKMSDRGRLTIRDLVHNGDDSAGGARTSTPNQSRQDQKKCCPWRIENTGTAASQWQENQIFGRSGYSPLWLPAGGGIVRKSIWSLAKAAHRIWVVKICRTWTQTKNQTW